MKSFLSLYDGTAENDFAKSKQPQGNLDVFLVVLALLNADSRGRRLGSRLGQRKTIATGNLRPYNLGFEFILLAVVRVFRQSEKGAFRPFLWSWNTGVIHYSFKNCSGNRLLPGRTV